MIDSSAGICNAQVDLEELKPTILLFQILSISAQSVCLNLNLQNAFETKMLQIFLNSRLSVQSSI